MSTFIRLTDYKSSDEKEQEFFKAENRYVAKQEDFEKIPGSPISYWVSPNVIKLIDSKNSFNKYANPRRCLATGNDDLYVRNWYEVQIYNIHFFAKNIVEAIKSEKKWFPFQKGGEFRKWYGNKDLIVNWFNDGQDIKNNQSNATLRNLDYSFLNSLTWSYLKQKKINVRYSGIGNIFSGAGGGVFVDDENMIFILGLVNTNMMNYIFESLFGKVNTYESGTLNKLPIIFPKQESIKQQIDVLTQQCIDISKEEWDSRETSWDFTSNALLKHKIDGSLEKAYEGYCAYWAEKFNTLHGNEEELNRLFIEIYELQDELTPDVALGDITILKNEATIEDGKLVFRADEIIKQFISYGVGVLFGRYSLDHEGLHVANMHQTLVDANASFNISSPSFEADEDNIIPVLEDDYFKDDITARFIQFVKVAFGEESLHVNVRFIENALGMSLRKYFVKGFYEDHIKRYKKRPIYWMVSSPKKGFMSLSYMHRYESDLFGRVRNSYLGEYITKLEAHKESLEHTLNSSSATDKDKKDADKRIKEIEVKLKELIAFDREKMMHFAQQHTDIDLDDGVKVNYTKFQDILFPIAGLSDEEK